MTSVDFDTCIFKKNPVHQQGRSLESNDRISLAGLQTFGVKLTGLNSSGFLENNTLKVTTSHTARLNVSNLSLLKIPVTKPSSSELEQLITYYYMNRAVEYLAPRGPLAINGQRINVIVDEKYSGWRPETKTIYLQRREGKMPAAFDGSQSLYLLGIANVYMASGGQVNPMAAGDANHNNCGADAKGCCATMNGCARALASGAATYFVAMLFPSAPVIGELSANRLAGIRLCNVSDRNLSSVMSQTAQVAYNLCASRPGDVNILGAVYASIWWNLRLAVPAEAYIIDYIYLEHLKQLNRNDTFITAKSKILSLDRQFNGGRFNQRIDAEFARRGL